MDTVISVRTNKIIKNAAQEVADSIGISLSSLINAYLKQIAVTRRVEFFAAEKMTPKMEKLIGQVEREIARGEVSAPFDTVDDFIKDLNKKER